MARSSLKTTVDKALTYKSEYCLRTLLEYRVDTIYRLATLKNRMRKDPSSCGICMSIDNMDIVQALSPSWKHYSGNEAYPIPGNKKSNHPELAYYYDHPGKRRWIGQQKLYRFSLIDHLLKNAPYFYKEVEKRLKQR